MPDAQQLVREFEDARYLRGTYESLWRDVARYTNSRRQFMTLSTPLYPGTGGRDLESQVYTSIGFMAADELANIMYSYIVPPSVPWFEFVAGNDPVAEDRDAQNWLLDLRNLILFYLYRSETGFNEALQEFFLDFVTLGTSCMYVDWYDRRLRTITRALDQNYLMTDAEGRVIKHFYYYTLSVEQAYYRFPALPDTYRQQFAAGQSSMQSRIPFIQCITPSSRSLDKFESTHILYDQQREISDTMASGSYDTFPYICPRWKRVPGEVYGRGQGMVALPSLRVADSLTKLLLESGQLRVRPPTQEPADSYGNPSNLNPGGRNFYKKGTRARIETIDIGGDINDGLSLLDAERGTIERIFYLDVARQFSLRGSASPLKATEVIERRDEVLRLLGPVVARLTTEFLDPLITRVYQLLDKKNLITPAIGEAPVSLNGTELKPAFSSAAAMSMRQSETGNIRAWLEDVGIVATFDPGALTTVNGDAIIRKSRQLRNVDPDLTRTIDQVQEIRSRQAQQQGLQQLAETATQGGAALTAVAEGVEAIGNVA